MARRDSFWRLVERSGPAIPVVVQDLYVVLAATIGFDVISPNPALAQSATVALRKVSVVDTRDGSIQPNQTVLVDRNRISAVGNASEVTIPVNAEIVDGGGYVSPGLWDMHVHSVADMAGDGSNGPVATHDWHFPMFLAHGVTGIRTMNDGTADVTLELTQSIRRRLAEGDLPGPPRFITAGPSVDGEPPLASSPLVVRTAAETRSAVEKLAANGADLIKVYENLSREAYFAVMDEARRGDSRRWLRPLPRHTRRSG